MKKAIIFIMTLVLLLVGCKSHNNKSLNLKVGTWKTAQTIQPFFYNDYINSNHTVEAVPFTNPGDMKTALLAGELNFCGTTLVTAITAASNGEPIVLVAGLANRCSALVVGKDSGVEKEADLKGKRIAYVPGTMHHLLLLEVLSSNGIDVEKDVELIRIDFFDMVQALGLGIIDAFYSGEPYPSIAVVEGCGRVLTYPTLEDNLGEINAAMITTKEEIKNNPEGIQALVDAHVATTIKLNDDRDTWLKAAGELGTRKEVLDIAVDNMELIYDIDDDYIHHVKALAGRMLEQGMIQQLPDFDHLFDLSFLKKSMEKDLK
ncbi:UNVERIFIED_CONTAM: NitT/TauT family transport system substrate-binding protein [Acetivibrio alkalicellulosi]